MPQYQFGMPQRWGYQAGCGFGDGCSATSLSAANAGQFCPPGASAVTYSLPGVGVTSKLSNACTYDGTSIGACTGCTASGSCLDTGCGTTVAAPNGDCTLPASSSGAYALGSYGSAVGPEAMCLASTLATNATAGTYVLPTGADCYMTRCVGSYAAPSLQVLVGGDASKAVACPAGGAADLSAYGLGGGTITCPANVTAACLWKGCPQSCSRRGVCFMGR